MLLVLVVVVKKVLGRTITMDLKTKGFLQHASIYTSKIFSVGFGNLLNSIPN